MTSSQSKGIQQVNNCLKAECKEDDELRKSKIEENVQNGGCQVAVQGNIAPTPPQQQPQGSLVHWERFLHVRSIKVMLVENDDCTRQIVTALLRNCNYEVIEAANGFQAWKILENLSNHIDIVLTEVVMPCISGVSLLCKIMSHKSRKNIPVIMMSSHDSMGLVFKCLSKGAVDFLVKPIRKNELKILWQHVWRRCHSSSGSGSESGTHAQKSVNSKSNLRYDNSGNNESSSGGSDNGSGTQSSWTKQAFECESPETASPCEHPDSTCGIVIRPLKTDSTHNGGKPKEIEVSDSKVPTPFMENGQTKSQREPEKVIDDANGVKRARETVHDLKEVENGCNILRRSELSAFTRYKTTLNTAKHTPGNYASCSQPNNNKSKVMKNESKPATHSDGYLNYQGSSQQVVQQKADVAHQDLQIQHIHHHHHVHHYHTIETEQPLTNQDDFGLNKLDADASHCGSSNIMGGPDPDELNIENRNLNNKSGSGSKHGSNVQNVNYEVTNVESDVIGLGAKNAEREAALKKFRQKREARCFRKKVRYINRKKLAEQRPRVRGQFVKGINHESSANK